MDDLLHLLPSHHHAGVVVHGRSLALLQPWVPHRRWLSAMAPESSAYIRPSALQLLAQPDRVIEIIHVKAVTVIQQAVHQRHDGVGNCRWLPAIGQDIPAISSPWIREYVGLHPILDWFGRVVNLERKPAPPQEGTFVDGDLPTRSEGTHESWDYRVHQGSNLEHFIFTVGWSGVVVTGVKIGPDGFEAVEEKQWKMNQNFK